MSTATRSIPFKIPKADRAYLCTLAGVQEHEELPKALEEIYIGVHRICSKLSRPVTLSEIVLVGYLAGVGLEAPPPPSMIKLYEAGVLKKDDLIEFRYRTGRETIDGKQADKYEWLTGRITGYTPSKGFVIRGVPDGLRYEAKHTNCRIKEEPVKAG